MFETFETRLLPGEGAEIRVRLAGSGPPLLLLHGYPQTGAMKGSGSGHRLRLPVDERHATSGYRSAGHEKTMPGWPAHQATVP